MVPIRSSGSTRLTERTMIDSVMTRAVYDDIGGMECRTDVIS